MRGLPIMSASKGKGRRVRKSKAKPAAKPRLGRRRARAKSGQTRALLSAPASYGWQTGGSAMQHREAGTVRHPFLGTTGIRVIGTQPLCIVRQATSDVKCLYPDDDPTISSTIDSGSFTGAASSGNFVEFDPLELGGILERYGNLYQRFVFRNIRIEFTTNIGTNSSNNGAAEIAFCISNDPGLTGAADPPNTFARVRCTTPSCTTVAWAPKCVLDYRYSGQETWFCQYSTSQPITAGAGSNAADNAARDLLYRNTSQAVLSCYLSWGISAPAPLTLGRFQLHYDVEFYGPVYSNISAYSDTLALKKSKPGFLRRLRPAMMSEQEEKKERKTKVSDEVPELGTRESSVHMAQNPLLSPSEREKIDRIQKLRDELARLLE